MKYGLTNRAPDFSGYKISKNRKFLKKILQPLAKTIGSSLKWAPQHSRQKGAEFFTNRERGHTFTKGGVRLQKQADP